MPQKHKLPPALKAAAKAFRDAYEKQREATNAATRCKTALRNAVKDEWVRRQLPTGSSVVVGGSEFTFAVTESEVIDPEFILKLYERKQITREQLLRVMSIGKADAASELGGDIVLAATVTKLGKKADIRMSDLPVERLNDEYILEADRANIPSRKRIVFKAKAAQDTLDDTPAQKVRTRKLKLPTRK